MRMLAYVVLGLSALAAAAIGVWVYVVQNVETPDYEVVRKDGAIEVRDYPALVVAEVTRTGPRREAVSAGFSPLAAYIFAKDRAGDTISMTAPVTQSREQLGREKIAMTAPVTQTRTASTEEGWADPGQTADEDRWIVRFIMPSQYKLDDLPSPGGGGVRLEEVPAKRRAAIRFSGHATDAAIAKHEAQLRAWLATQGLIPDGPPTYAYYNDPWTPGPLRRNEVIFDTLGQNSK